MDEALLAAFHATDYRVCLDEAEIAPAHPVPDLWASTTPSHPAPAALAHPWASATPAHPAPAALAHPWASWECIRIGQRLPTALQALTAERPWGFITAWNPRAQPCAVELNLAAQHELLTALREWPDATIRQGVGVGAGGWYEPGLFVIGPDIAMLDMLGRRHRQHAYVCGSGDQLAQLRWLHD